MALQLLLDRAAGDPHLARHGRHVSTMALERLLEYPGLDRVGGPALGCMQIPGRIGNPWPGAREGRPIAQVDV